MGLVPFTGMLKKGKGNSTSGTEKKGRGSGQTCPRIQNSRIVALSMFSPFPCRSPQLQCPFVCLFVHQTSVEHLPRALCSVPRYKDEHSGGRPCPYQPTIWNWDGPWPEDVGNVKGVGFGDRSSRLRSLTWPVIGCTAWRESLLLFEPWFPHLSNGANSSTYRTGLSEGLNTSLQRTY